MHPARHPAGQPDALVSVLRRYRFLVSEHITFDQVPVLELLLLDGCQLVLLGDFLASQL